MKVDYDIAVIGSGPAGMTAGLYAARAGLKAVAFERLFAGGQIATTGLVENYPGFPDGVDGGELADRIARQAEALGLETRYDDIASLSLAGNIKEIHAPGGMITASAVILCMGAVPRTLGVPGEDRYRGAGVSYCATCDGGFFKGKRVAVVGGGDTAAEDAAYLSGLCSEVLLIHRRTELRAAATLAEKALSRQNVTPVWNAKALEIRGNSAVQGLVLDVGGSVREEAVSAVFVAIGSDPSTNLVRGQVNVDENGYILAGEDTRTSIPLVYAAGDIRRKPLRQLVTAVSDGAVAVYAALEDGLR